MENTQVGPFLILGRLGNNRRHRVYRARQVDQGKDVALKFIKVPPKVPWHQALDKLNREVNQLQQLRHPNLVKVFGAGVDGKQIFFASELVEGESLSALLSRRGKLAPDLVVDYGRQIAACLSFIHQKNLIHSKLTPEKILIQPDHTVKVGDLRLNRAKRRRWDAMRRRELDTVAYMAPEQFGEGATEKSDFYALGVILYEMLSGQLPYPPDTVGRMAQNKRTAPVPSVATHVMNCPIWLDKMITQMLDPDPRQRPHSAHAIVLAFEEIKNIDATRQAAVSQMTSGFNPLTAGQDKTEAKKLLGEKPDREETMPTVPLYQRIWFQALALIVLVAIIVGVAMQPSDRATVEKARRLVASDEFDDWLEARRLLQPVIDRRGTVAPEAESLYFESRRKSMLFRVKARQVTRIDSENFQQFSKAYHLEQEGRTEDAADVYATLVNRIDPAGDQRHIFQEAKSRYENLTREVELPKEPEALMRLVAATDNATTEAELIEAQRQLGGMSIRLAGDSRYRDVLQEIDQQLVLIKERLVSLQSSEDAAAQDRDGGGPPAGRP